MELAIEREVTYTRYADDLFFSTNSWSARVRTQHRTVIFQSAGAEVREERFGRVTAAMSIRIAACEIAIRACVFLCLVSDDFRND